MGVPSEIAEESNPTLGDLIGMSKIELWREVTLESCGAGRM